MNRSRSRGRLIETAFVSQTCSSTEDLDEVDRLANHPVLRSLPLRPRTSLLRKSRSEAGGDLGLSIWAPGEVGGGSASTQCSPNASYAHHHHLHHHQSLLSASRRYPSRMTRSTTINANLSSYAAPDPPSSSSSPVPSSTFSAPSSWIYNTMAARSAPSTPPTWKEVPPTLHPVDSPCSSGRRSQAAPSSAHSSRHVIQAVIEPVPSPLPSTTGMLARECVTPPPSVLMAAGPRLLTSSMCPDAAAAKTPPNTAPLPTKFSRVPQNLLRSQRAAAAIENADSSSNSNNELAFDGGNQSVTEEAEYKSSLPASVTGTTTTTSMTCQGRFRLPLSLKTRLQSDHSQQDSSSAESTPQKLPLHRSHHQHHYQHHSHVKRGAQVNQPLPPKPVLNLVAAHNVSSSGVSNNKCIPSSASNVAASKQSPKSKFFSSGESSCGSSAMSSLESIRSNASDGVQSLMSSESGAAGSSTMSSSQSSDLCAGGGGLSSGFSRPSLDFRHSKHVSSSSKFQILSPISDKSQEQYSEAGDQNKTPKVSPSESVGVVDNQASPNNNSGKRNVNTHILNNNNNNNNLASANANDNDQTNILQALDVPWEVPKLRRRLQREDNLNHHRRRTTMANFEQLQGSDSGISMASQDVQEMKELLNVPWDMPKLRKKTRQFLSDASGSGSRPHSMPVTVQADCEQQEAVQDDNAVSSKVLSGLACGEYVLSNENNASSRESLNAEATAVPNSSFNDNAQPLSKSNLACPPPSSSELTLLPPPPPGFEDSGDEEFYLTQTNPQSSPALRKDKKCGRKQRPKMTLSFGVDPSLKTLMFATNSPFSLNDCEEVDPNLPFDRQDWYHGVITRSEAENILRSHQEGAYLVRSVDTNRQEFALSLKSALGFMHMRLRRDPLQRDFRLSDFPRRFMTVSQMVHHYTRNRLPIRGAEHMCLKRPVATEQLL